MKMKIIFISVHGKKNTSYIFFHVSNHHADNCQTFEMQVMIDYKKHTICKVIIEFSNVL